MDVCVSVCCVLSHSVLSNSFATPRTVAHWAPLLVGFPRQEYRTGLPNPSPGDLADPGIKPVPPPLTGGLFTTEATMGAQSVCLFIVNRTTRVVVNTQILTGMW